MTEGASASIIMARISEAREVPRSRSSVRWWILGASVVVALVGAWIGAHHLREVPPDPFAHETLSSGVRAEDNGVILARRLPRELAPQAWSSVVDATMDVDAAWRRATERSLELRELVDAHVETLDAIDAKPRFVEDCEPDVNASCELLPLLRSIELASLAALAEVATMPAYEDEPIVDVDAWRRADTRSAEGIARARDFHEHAYSLVGTMLALVMLERSVEGAAPLVEGAATVGVRLPLLREALAEPYPAPSLRRGLLFDHRMMRGALLANPPKLLFDRARSVQELDERARVLIAYADDPSGPAPEFPLHEASFGWWLYDPVGKQLLDVVAADGARLVPRAQAGHADAEAAREALLTRIDALHAALP